MKNALKKIVALALSSATAFSVFAASASAAQYVYTGYPSKDYSKWCSVCGEYHYGYTHDAYGGYYDINGKWHSWDDVYDGSYYGYYSYVTLTAQQYKNGKISAAVPNSATTKSYKWTGLTNIREKTGSTGSSVTIDGIGSYSATCEVTFTYKVGTNRTVTDTVKVTISGYAYKDEAEAGTYGSKTKSVSNYSNYYPGYYPDYDYTNGFWYNGKWYSYSDGYYYNGRWYPYSSSYPSYSYRDEYTVDWSTDTFYYDGEKHVPTATVTVGNRTIKLNVSLTSGNGIDVGRHRVVARVPSGYSGIKLDGASLYYNIEEPLKSGFVYEDGYTYYYEGGKAVTGWKTISGDTYYFEKGGKAATGWRWLNNAWYYFGSDGKMQTGWVRDGGKIYYCYDSGVMAKSTWLKLDGYWYYFYNDGRMAESEWVYSGGKWYFLAGDGRMATNTTIPGGYYVDSTGAWVK